MLVYWNLWAMIRRRRLFLVPMVLAFLASVMGILIVQNLLLYIENYNVRYDELSRAYILGTDSISLEAGLSALTARSEVVRVQAAVQGEETSFIANVYGDSPMERPVQIGAYFGEESYQQGLAQVVITEEEAESQNLHVGDTYELCGQVFTVIGIGYDFNSIQIPYAALEDRSGVYALSVVTEEIGTAAEQEAFAAFLQELFHVEEVQLPTPRESDAGMDTVLILAVMLLGVFSMSFLYVFYLESRQRMFAVYTLVGCRRVQLIRILCEETLILVTGMYVLAVLLTKGALWLLKPVGEMFGEMLSMDDYLQVFAIACGLVFVVLTLQLLNFFRKTPNERRRAL